MVPAKEDILRVTNRGLDVFRHLIPGDWKVGKKFLNPFYPDSRASCHIYLEKRSDQFRIHDFGEAGFSGDCFFLMGYLLGKDCRSAQDFTEILSTINHELGLGLGGPSPSAPRARVQFSPQPIAPMNLTEPEVDRPTAEFSPPVYKHFTPLELEYWAYYGITPEILSIYRVGSIERFESATKEGRNYQLHSSEDEPIFCYSAKKHLKLYRPFSKLRFLYAGSAKEGYVFGLEQLPLRGDVLFITGGEKDVMSLAARGLPAICFNSETASIPKTIIKRLSFRFKHIVLLYDTDKTGMEASARHVQELLTFEVKRLVLPLAGTKSEKDVSDYFRKGHAREDLMRLFCAMLDELYEETMAVLRSCEIDFANPPVRPEPLVSINNVIIGAPGNLLCITGSEGSGKTNYLGGVIAGAICTDESHVDTLGTEVRQNLNGKAVLVYDTEQSEDQLFKNLSYVLRRAHLSGPPPWFRAYCMVGMSRKERMQSILQSIDKFYYQHGGIHLIVIDGIADLLDGVNDEEKSVQLVEELFRLAGIYKTLIIVVLHMTPSGLKLRGHLGSEIQRKAAGILSIEKDPEKNTSVIKALKVRDGSPMDVPLVQFGWDKVLNHHVYLGEKDKDAQDQRKMEDLTEIAREVFRGRSSLTYQELVLAVMNTQSVRDRQAKNYIRHMKDAGLVAKTGIEGTEWVLTELPF